MNPISKKSCKFCEYSSPSGASMAVHIRTEHKNNETKKVTEENIAVMDVTEDVTKVKDVDVVSDVTDVTETKVTETLNVRKEHVEDKTDMNKVIVIDDSEVKNEVIEAGNNIDVKVSETTEKNKVKKVTKAVKKFKCDKCEFSTKNSAYLPKHKENMHKNKREDRKRPKPDQTSSTSSSPDPKIRKVDENEDLNKTVKTDDEKGLSNQLMNPDNTNYIEETNKVIIMKTNEIVTLTEKS